MCLIYFECCHNVCFFVLNKVSFTSPIFVITIFSTTFLTILFAIFPAPIRSHGCLREENFSGGNNTFRKEVRVDFGTPNFTRISEQLDLSSILPLRYRQSSQSVYVCPWIYGRLILVLTYICCWLSDSTKRVSRYSYTDSSLISI